jgi:hypothetical protein
VCAQHQVLQADFERWQQTFVQAATRALDPNTASDAEVAAQMRELHTKIGAQAMELETLKKKLAGA